MGDMKIRLRELREAKGLNQDQLGEKIGKSGAMVSRYERGRGLLVSQLPELADALGCHPAEIIEDAYDLSETEREIMKALKDMSESEKKLLLGNIRTFRAA